MKTVCRLLVTGALVIPVFYLTEPWEFGEAVIACLVAFGLAWWLTGEVFREKKRPWWRAENDQ